jgi:hypothetical protein
VLHENESMQNTVSKATGNHARKLLAGWFAKFILENNLIPSSTKFRKPSRVAFVGDCRCWVDASKHRSTADEIPDADSKIRIRDIAEFR